MSCENILRILFTPYPIHSDLGAMLPVFDFNGSSVCRQLKPRFTELVSTFSLLVSSARLQILNPEEKK